MAKMTLGERIKYLREKNGYAQKFIAEKIGVKNNTLSSYESDKRQPDYDTLQKIADFFEVSVDYLLGRTTQPSKILNEETREFVDNLELSDKEILTKFKFMVDGKPLTEEQARRFVALIRAERAIEAEE